MNVAGGYAKRSPLGWSVGHHTSPSLTSSNPDIATVLRQMKIPERMTSSQALRDFLLANTEDGRNVPTGPEQVLQLNGLLLLSHLEVINALGALEERFALEHYQKFQQELKKHRKRRWW